jgi:tRNA pseudouridine13 synthase
MWSAKAEAGALEAEVLEAQQLTLDDFGRAKVEGSRRLGRLLVPEIETEISAESVTLRFFLPKGAYATTVVREFMKIELPDAPVFDGEE